MGEAGDATTQANERRPRGTFSVRLGRWMLLVAALPLLLTAAISLRLTSETMRRSVLEEVTSLRNASLLETRRELTEQQNLVALLSQAPRLQDPDPVARQRYLREVHRLYPQIRWVGLADASGRIIASSGNSAPGHSLSPAFMRRALQRPVVGDAQPSLDASHVPVFVYGVPLAARNGRPGEALIAMMGAEHLIAYLHEGRVRGSGETYLVRGDGLLLSESRFEPQAPLRLTIRSKGFAEAAAGRTGTATYRDYRGIPVIGSFAPLIVNPSQPDSPRWVLLSEVDESEALAPVTALARAIISVTLVMLGLVGVAVRIISRQVTEPLRQLEAGANGLSQENWGLRVAEDAPDEFGELAMVFNRMAAKVGLTVSQLRAANAALEASDRRFRLVVDNAPVILLYISPDGLLSFAEGKALEPIMGTDHAWTGCPYREAFRDYPAFVASLQKAMKGDLERDEVELDSQVFQIWYAVPRERPGPEAGLIGVATDVTARKRLEARLAEAQRIAHMGSWEWDIQTGQITWSEEMFRIFGLTPPDGPQTRDAFFARVHPEDRAVMEQKVGRAARDGQPYEADYRIVRPDGEIRHIHSSSQVALDAQQRPHRLIGTALDITERKRIEADQLRTLTLLRAQQEATLDGILVVDERRAVIGYNRRFVELWQIPTDLIADKIEQQLLTFVLPKLKDPDHFLARVQELSQEPMASARDEVELLDGRVFDRYTAPVVSPQGEFFGRIWSFRDLTERRKLEDTLREQNAKLRELDQLKNDFVNAMSHDLRAPLTSILGYSEFLEDQIAGPLTPQQADYVQFIQTGTRHMEHMVNDLLDFARLEAGSLRLNLEAVNLAASIRSVVESMQPQLEEAGLRLEVELPDDLPPVWADSARMERVIANLVSNAIKFTPAGGEIRVRGHLAEGRLTAEVSDTGEGIAAEDLPKLFKRFSQLESGRRHKGGTGLGLSISKSIVEAHGGSIGVRSQLGVGSTFWFSLPLSPPPASP